MRRYMLPHPDSRAHRVLAGLHAFGGRADLRMWMSACAWPESLRKFGVVIDRLVYLQLVEPGADGYKLTPDGAEHLGVDIDAPPVVAPAPAASRTFTSERPLTTKHMMRMPLMREGALDYLAIPSRIGDRAMPHQVASSMATRGDQK